jgi:hypothetical protein
MVQVECFKFELVDATTKIPFKEHTKDGRTYVEAEPDAEYFLSMQKIAKTETDVAISYSIDGQHITGYNGFRRKSIDREPSYKGIRSRAGDVSSHASLVFSNPTDCHRSSGSASNLQMGKVEIKIHELRYSDNSKHKRGDIVSTFTAASVNLHDSGTGKKKRLRSDTGSAAITKRLKSSKHHRSKRGAHKDTSKYAALSIDFDRTRACETQLTH